MSIRRKRSTKKRLALRVTLLESRRVLSGSPNAAPNDYDVNEDTVLVANLLSDDNGGGVDAPAATAFATSVNGTMLPIGGQIALPSGATLQLGANGQFTYDPSTSATYNALATGESAVDSFEYTIADGFSELYVFGDSLSDPGNLFALTGGAFPPDPPYSQGRSADGPLWAEYLAPRMNIAATDVHNFAIFGAGTGRANFNEARLGIDLPGVLDEVDQFLAHIAGGPANPNALYVVWAGPDDFFDPPADPVAAITESVTNLVTTISTLQAVGAQHILVPNMPDLGSTPFAIGLGIGDALSAFSAGFNTALDNTLAGFGIDALRFDSLGFFNGLVADATAHGLTNVTEPCFNEVTFAICSTPEEYGYWDSVHPTTRVHEILADAMLAELLTHAPLATTDTATVTIDIEGATTLPQAFVSGPTVSVPGHATSFTFSANDSATTDAQGEFQYHIDWNGDGSEVETIVGPATGVVVTHAFDQLGTFQVAMTAIDHDGDQSPVATQAISVEPAILSDGDLLVGGTHGRDRLFFREHSGNRVSVYLNRHRLGPFDLDGTPRVVAYGMGGNDFMSAGNLSMAVEFYGGAGNDFLRGSAQADLLVGGSGDDSIYGYNGNDELLGDDGRDRLYGGLGDDLLRGGTGGDILSGGDGDDQQFGGEGHDFLYGGNGNDLLNGGAGNDLVLGGEGRDMILGELGNDRLFGNGDDDEIDGGEGIDLIFGGPGLDTILNGERGFQ